MLNTIGSEKTSTRDKEVIINESYLKVFRDDLVQIEDDLLDDRKVITNKDVSAYLRDVDFFFKTILFDFDVTEIKKQEREDGSSYFLVSFESSIEGITLDGQKYKLTQPRFLEVNVNPEAEDLKIASIYSTKISREKELRNWWENLSFGWKNVFKNYVSFDSISADVLMEIASIDSLNLDGNSFIQDIEPLVALKELRILDISNTRIEDLEPLRYSMKLKKLKAHNSGIQAVEFLAYFEELEYLDLSRTGVFKIESIGELENLRWLNLSITYAINFDALKHLKNLQYVNLTDTEFSNLEALSASKNLKQIFAAQTKVGSIAPIKDLKQLLELDVSETQIQSLTGVENHPSLRKISFNRTAVNDLTPLQEVPNLKKVYADYSQVSEVDAANFIASRPGVLLVTNSEKVQQWWSDLPANWKHVFGTIIGNQLPGKEDLVKLINVDSLDLSDQNLYEVAPLKKFKRLKYLDVSQNLFTSFEFTQEMSDLAFLNGSNLPIKSTIGLENNAKLQYLILKGSLLNDLTSLKSLKNLELLDIDDTEVDEKPIVSLLNATENLVVIYQSVNLATWYADLRDPWKKELAIEKEDSYHLHQLIEQEEIILENAPIASLAPLNEFINLKKVVLNNVRVTDLKELYNHKSLTSITCSNGPLQSLEGISALTNLEEFNIQNTGIDDLKELDGMRSIKHLNCAGTSIKNLKGVSELYNLETIDVSNTRVWKLQRLYGMQNLKKLVCFNTRLRQHTIDDFQTVFPDCEINFY